MTLPVYAQLEKQYAKQRKYAPIGAKVGSSIWLKKDEEKGCFVYQLLYSRNGAGAANREKYTMDSFMEVYPDRVEVFHPKHPNSCMNRAGAFLHRFDIEYRKSTSIKVRGWQWSVGIHSKKPTSYVTPGRLIFDVATSTYSVSEEPGVRTFDKTKQKALNDHIKAARRMLGLRARLGAFNGLSWVQVDKEMGKKYKDNAASISWGNPHIVNDILMGIDEENYETLIPVLWLALKKHIGYYSFDHVATRDMDWLAVFNKYIDSQREKLRTLNGAVSYVVNDKTAQGPEGTKPAQEDGDRSEADGEEQLCGMPVPVHP